MSDVTPPDAPAKSVADLIAPHLPYLRRFARALTGSQAVGDQYVVATLETLIADRSVFDPHAGPRVALYKVFYQLWSRSGGADVPPGDRPVSSDPLAAQVSSLTPRNRQALLLTAMEGFDTASAATIMGVGAETVDALAHEAVQAIRSQKSARVLVIEDEAIIAMDLEAIVEDLGHDVVATAATADDAVAAARKEHPDLVLADIQLADGSSGVDAVKVILEEMDVPVIFITAYPERLLTGERPEPTYLVTKPFHTEEVVAAIGQALFKSPAH